MRRWLASLHPLERLAVVLWTAMIVGITVRLAAHAPLTGSVMAVYYFAGLVWRAGGDVYGSFPGMDVYRNPPGVTPLFALLTHLPPMAADILWRFACAGLFLWGFRSWLAHGLPFALSRGQRGAMYVLAAPLVLASLNNGQTNILLVSCLLLGTAAVSRSRFRSGSVWLAAGAAVKLYPAAVGLLLAAAYPRRVLPWFLLAFAAFLALPYLDERPGYAADMYRSFAAKMQADDRTFAALWRAPHDLFLLLRVWVAPPPREAYLAVQLGVAAAMAGIVALMSWRGRPPSEVATLSLGLGCLWMTVLGPASEVPTYSVLAPTAALAVVQGHAGRKGAAGVILFALCVLAYGLLISPILRDAFPDGGNYRGMAPMAAGGVVLLVVVVWQAFRGAGEAKQTDRESPQTNLPLAA